MDWKNFSHPHFLINTTQTITAAWETLTTLALMQGIIFYSIQNFNTMNEQLRIKREELKSISQGFKLLLKEGAIGSINEGLANYYAEQGHTTLKSYRRWQEEGFQVKKGTHALLMWGEPKPFKNTEQKIAENKEDQKDETFFPIAFVFSNLQVYPIKK